MSASNQPRSYLLIGATWLAVIAGTAACGIAWQRHGRFQITLRGLFVLLTIAAGILALYQRGLFSPHEWLQSAPQWHLIAPRMQGVAAVVYWVCAGIMVVFRSLLSDRHTPPA